MIVMRALILVSCWQGWRFLLPQRVCRAARVRTGWSLSRGVRERYRGSAGRRDASRASDFCAESGQRVLLGCSVPGRPRFGLEVVLDDFSIQGPTADFQNPRRLLLVPRNGVEHADDVRPLGVAQRRQPWWALGDGHGNAGVKKLDVGLPNNASGRRERRARYRAFELANVARPRVGLQTPHRFR